MQIFLKESVKKVGFCGNLLQNESAKMSKVPLKNELYHPTLTSTMVARWSRGWLGLNGILDGLL